MNILIPDKWLRKFLGTKATPVEIAKYLSLCGPSIERIKKGVNGDNVYSIEVTTNRVDSASVLGIAREASAILPRFGVKATFKNINAKNINAKFDFKNKVKYLDVVVDPKLCSRFTAVLIKNVKIGKSPKEIIDNLENVGVRSINNIIDVSNYIMHELGQPVHTFDFDKIINGKMTLRESKKDEVVKTLDGKEFKLNGKDIVIEGATGDLIDLCGIMGGEKSMVDDNTRNVLLFVQNYNKHYIRKTSMLLGQRTEAAVLFEKGLDSEGVKPAILSAITMMEKLSGGKAEKEILDIYPDPQKEKIIKTNINEINKIIGLKINKNDIVNYMQGLGFAVKQQGDALLFTVPSWRADDINIKEDIVEEIARIYGYHNLPCVLMGGDLPKPKLTNDFKFEYEVKQILKALGATEIYNLSLVDKGDIGDASAIKLKNPLGDDTSYLRNNLKDSLIKNVKDNPQEKGHINIFEIANIYLPRKNDLPIERLLLCGIIRNPSYRENKGLVEGLLEELKINYTCKLEDGKDYLANQRIRVLSGKETVGEYGNLENGLFAYEFDMSKLINSKKVDRKYREVAKFPPQVEDLTLIIPSKTLIGEIIEFVKNLEFRICNFELIDIYDTNYTFNIQYQSDNHTLTDEEVKEIRQKIIKALRQKFAIIVKE